MEKLFTTKNKVIRRANILGKKIIRITEEKKNELSQAGLRPVYYNSGIYGHNWDVYEDYDYIYIHGYRNIPSTFASYPKEIKRDYLISLQ